MALQHAHAKDAPRNARRKAVYRKARVSAGAGGELVCRQHAYSAQGDGGRYGVRRTAKIVATGNRARPPMVILLTTSVLVALSKITLPEDFAVWDWRADGRLVGSREFSEDPSPVMVVPGAKPQPVHGLEGRSVLGMNVSRDGNWAVAATSEYNHSHIVRVDLKAGEAVALTRRAAYGEYQAAKISPGDTQVSWIHRTGAVNAGSQATGCGREDDVYVRVRTSGL